MDVRGQFIAKVSRAVLLYVPLGSGQGGYRYRGRKKEGQLFSSLEKGVN